MIKLFENHILSLLRANNLKYFFNEFTKLLKTIISKDKKITNMTIKYLNKCWPVKFPEKECLFINIIETVK